MCNLHSGQKARVEKEAASDQLPSFVGVRPSCAAWLRVRRRVSIAKIRNYEPLGTLGRESKKKSKPTKPFQKQNYIFLAGLTWKSLTSLRRSLHYSFSTNGKKAGHRHWSGAQHEQKTRKIQKINWPTCFHFPVTLQSKSRMTKPEHRDPRVSPTRV